MNEVGLSAAFNMKRVRVLSGEVEQSEDGLFPLIFNMLQCRYSGFEALKERYNITVKVDFGSVWKRKALELIDDKIPETSPVTTEENPDESQLGDTTASTSNSSVGNVEEKAEIEAMLLDETLTDDDRATLMEMLAE